MGADLRSVDFGKADLRQADFRQADLHGADLRGADVRGAKMSTARVVKVPTEHDDTKYLTESQLSLMGAHVRASDE
jgi:Uncharacterized low-complexity proteins